VARSRGHPISPDYYYPGMTIVSADKGTLEFGLRSNGWSLPVKIVQDWSR